VFPGGQVSTGFQVSGPDGSRATAAADSDADKGTRPYTREELDAMKKEDLKEIAEAEEIDVPAPHHKDDYIGAILKGTKKK
jgi:hypothetical protein